MAAAIAIGPLGATHASVEVVNPWETLPTERRLPSLAPTGHVAHDGASIWYGQVGAGSSVVLLHGGNASSDTWGNQVPALVANHFRVTLIDSRGHGRSTLGDRPLSYELIESDVIAALDELHIKKTSVVGWSDGANISLVMAMKHPSRLTSVYAFGANMDTHPGSINTAGFSLPILKELGPRLARDYARLSPTPNGFEALHAAVEKMQEKEPDYTAAQLSAISGPRIMISDGDHDEFITRAHTEYLARTIPGARLEILQDVSHFAPWQAPKAFNRSAISFLRSSPASWASARYKCSRVFSQAE